MPINWEQAYHRLFDIIDADGNKEAPQYFTGSKFINTLKGISYNFPQNYSRYIETRTNQKQSTSRRLYYQEILDNVPEAERVAAYKAIFAELGTFTNDRLTELKRMFGDGGDETIRAVAPADPVMSYNNYQIILQTLRRAILSLEQKPDLYSVMGEEQMRDYLIGLLEHTFQNTTATRESFNRAGRTDILVRHASGNNLFVAECKNWTGQAGMLAAVNQLMGYLTYRDNKAALLLFVDRADITTVLNRIDEAIITHMNYKRSGEVTNRASKSHVFSLPGDPDGEVTIEIMVGHFPQLNP
ncbi:hypothetical protein SAMN05518672_108199 [Chitinophaga sp. CF118]|uniref:hypothetical protein n=1 Tax=Chitinophaga sp. CF118 TaxID=1884367 RepID=UPI0008E8DDAB|nr:hypothetical protein [Chitinophaga sp. CF118]SFE63879.1 hypothetical protein SAMN05518672_108199 [Chitinophaga sp. CF118]